MSLYSKLKGNGPSGFGYGSTAEEVTEGLDLSGRNYLVTGSNSGLGFETMRVLCSRGATVVAAARTVEKAEKAGAKVDGNTVPVACELSEPSSVLACVDAVRDQVGHLDGIIANAGIMALPDLNLQHGYELQFFTNHIGHFILVTGLLDQLSDDGRVVMLSSTAHKMGPKGGIQFDNLDGSKGYDGWKFYGQSKLANLLFARSLAKRLPLGQTANAVHPGVIETNLGRHMHPLMNAGYAIGNLLFLKSIPQGAATQVFVATHDSVSDTNGEYFADCNVAKSSHHGRDEQLAETLWDRTEEIVAEVT
jgi:NAD(P)-dependent dehydrogenase (short-subunit alcohol dehydrogenase family)